jgi:hypothetical protein
MIFIMRGKRDSGRMLENVIKLDRCSYCVTAVIRLFKVRKIGGQSLFSRTSNFTVLFCYFFLFIMIIVVYSFTKNMSGWYVNKVSI